MRCPMEARENSEILLAYCARKLDPDMAVVLERHMEQCPACREFRDAQEAVWKALDEWDAAPVSEDFDRRLYGRIEQEIRLPWWQRLAANRSLARYLVPLAAAVCLLIGAGLLLERPRHSELRPEEIRAEAVQPEQVERTLDDMEMLHSITLAGREAAEQKTM